MAKRVFIFHETTDNYRTFDFLGAAQASENWSPGFTTIAGAAANYTHIYLLDVSGTTAIARRFAIDQTREATGDITMNSNDTYSGIALTRTHLVAINRTDNRLEYYALEDRAYDATLDVALPSVVSGEYFSGICRSGEFLYLVTEDTTAPHNPRIFKRNLDGTAVSDWAGQLNTTALTIFATDDRINIVRKVGGHWDRWGFDGTQDTTLNTAGSGIWAAAYTTFDLATVAFSTPVVLSNGNIQFNMTWTGGHTGFGQDRVSLNVGTFNYFIQVSGSVYQAEVVPPSEGSGTIEMTIREDAVAERNAAVTFTVGTYESGPANLTISSPVAVMGLGETRTFRIDSNREVTLEAGDVTQTGGATLANFAGSGTRYSIDVTAPAMGPGNIVISIAENAVPEENVAASFTIPYREILAPTIVFDRVLVNPGGVVEATISYPYAVTEFVVEDLSLAGGGMFSNFTAVGTDNRVWTVDIIAPASGSGDVTLNIAADVVPERNLAVSESFAYSFIPNVPSNIEVIGHNGALVVNWENPSNFEDIAPTGFRISIDGTTWIDLGADVFSYRFIGLTNGETYTVHLEAIAGSLQSPTATVTGVPIALSIENINEQFIAVGTTDYDLVIDIIGEPDTAIVKGRMEGFGQDWDAVNGQLHIKSEEVTRLIDGVNWDIELVKDMETLMAQIAYNVVEAAPIFGVLGTIHLYRGVPINFDIIIENVPPLLIPDAELLGLKSDLVEYGINVQGEISSTDNFAFNSGNVSIIVPSDSDGEDTIYNYPYEIEAGSPGQIETPVFTPKGGYGALEFTDVTHALGYEWTLQEGEVDRVDWNVFDSTRQLIDPDAVEVTPGQLQATIRFPNIAGVSSYEYRLESEDHEVDWTKFTGTLADGFITTIIPDLEDGVAYTLRLRVASPWVGTPISVPVYGGRLAYVIHSASADSTLFIFHTGVPNGGIAEVIKEIILPTGCTTPIGLGIENGIAYVYNDPDDRIFVFNTNTAHNTRASAIRTFTSPNRNYSTMNQGVLTVFDSVIYQRSDDGGVRESVITYSADTADGTTATLISDRIYFEPGFAPNQRLYGLDVTEDILFKAFHFSNFSRLALYDRDTASPSSIPKFVRIPNLVDFAVIGSIVYLANLTSVGMNIFDINHLNNGQNFSADLSADQTRLIRYPLGLTNPKALKLNR